MIKRVVKMTFQKDKISDFEDVFAEKQKLIAAFEGCGGVELLRDIHHPHVFFTISSWKSEEELNQYRNSALFHETWSTVKNWFADKPAAWSLTTV